MVQPTSTATPILPAAPGNLSIWGIYGAVGFTLSWEDNSGGEDTFPIERNGSEIAQVPTGATSFADEDLPDGSTFCYRLRTGNGEGFSDYTDEVCGTIVWPTLDEIELGAATPGEEVQVTAHGGYLRIGESGYDESSRPFALYFDGSSVNDVGCYVVSCRGSFTVPSDASVGDHQVCAEGGSCVTLRVVQATPTPTPVPGTDIRSWLTADISSLLSLAGTWLPFDIPANLVGPFWNVVKLGIS